MNEYIKDFCMYWPVRELGDREELLWDELDALKFEKTRWPEPTGMYYLERGVELFRISLKILGLCNVDIGTISEKEQPILKLYLDEQEKDLVKKVQDAGLPFPDENLYWDFYRRNHPEYEGAFFFWTEFAKLWKMLTGKKINPDISCENVRGHLVKAMDVCSKTGWTKGMMRILENTGLFQDSDPYLYKEKCPNKCDALKDYESMYRMVIDSKEEFILNELIKRNFFTSTSLSMIMHSTKEDDLWIMPYVVMAEHGANKGL